MIKDDINELKANGHNKKRLLSVIREHCKICCGDSSVDVCNAKDSCKLYPYRYGKNPFLEKREMSEEQKEAAKIRLNKYRHSNI